MLSAVRQVTFSGIGGMKVIDGNSVGSLKYDGVQFCLHIKSYKAYALTSKRISKKTGLLSDRIENFPELKKIKFPFKKETIIVCEVVAEHLGINGVANLGYDWSKRVNLVTSIMNAKPETVKEKYPNGNPLKLVAFSVLMWEGVDVSSFSFLQKEKMLKSQFYSAGSLGEKLNEIGETEFLFRTDNFLASDLRFYSLADVERSIRNKNFIYEGFVFFDRHTNNSIKVKRTGTVDAIILGADFNSTGRYKERGWIKSISVGLLKEGVKFKKDFNRLNEEGIKRLIDEGNLIHVGNISGMNEEVRKDISENLCDWLGTIAEIGFMQFTGKALRHPYFIRGRSDKFIYRCTMGQLT